MASLVTNLLSGGLLSGISGLINTIRGKSPEDAAKLADLAAKYQSDIIAQENQMAQMQADVNKVEAASSNWLIAGWRPYCGWIAGTGLLMQFLVGPFFTWVSGWLTYGHPGPFPTLDTGTLTTLLFGMLGLGAMRSFDKKNGTSNGH